METLPWPPGRDDLRLGIVLETLAAGDGALLKLRLVGGGEACTLVEEAGWTVGERVRVHYGTTLGGMRRIERVCRLSDGIPLLEIGPSVV